MKLDQQIEITLDPINFIKNFETLEDFREWALDKTVSYLQDAILIFQQAELYEHCAVMQKLIDDLYS